MSKTYLLKLFALSFYISHLSNISNASDICALLNKNNPILFETPNPNVPQPLSHVTYKLIQKENPSADELSAYKRIKQVMDSAIHYYNVYTTYSIPITVNYVTTKGVRADAGDNGKMRFGPERIYMNVGTALHEISHTIGVGSGKWQTFMTRDTTTGKTIFKGKNATNMLRQITGNKTAVIYMDNQHFWPFGLNYATEYKSESDLINHCKIMNAMKMDGL